MPSRTRLIAIGACAIDTILTVPYYPAEDSKLRATSFQKRRGGNAPNTLEVLQQLICQDEKDKDSSTNYDGSQSSAGESSSIELHLIATLPSTESPQMRFMKESFVHCSENDGTTSSANMRCPHISLQHCIHRPNYMEPVSSYIIASQATSTRTIVNHAALPEMTFPELHAQLSPLLSDSDDVAQIWIHFEGRNVEVALECVRFLQSHRQEGRPHLRISVELEKPGREGLRDLAGCADVIFYSRSWAEGEGYAGAEECLKEQWDVLSAVGSQSGNPRLLICTWGSKGACASTLPSKTDSLGAFNAVHSCAYIAPGEEIVDTTGAGDTFIAGVLFGLICRSDEPSRTGCPNWSLQQTLDFANGLAGRKILQQGFRGLEERSKGLKDRLNRDTGTL